MNLIWFRCDLRTTDNNALLAAADGRPCLALYLLSPAQWREHDDAPCKVDFWLRNLGELQRQLAALNIPLLVRDCGHWRQAPKSSAGSVGSWESARYTSTRNTG